MHVGEITKIQHECSPLITTYEKLVTVQLSAHRKQKISDIRQEVCFLLRQTRQNEIKVDDELTRCL